MQIYLLHSFTSNHSLGPYAAGLLSMWPLAPDLPVLFISAWPLTLCTCTWCCFISSMLHIICQSDTTVGQSGLLHSGSTVPQHQGHHWSWKCELHVDCLPKSSPAEWRVLLWCCYYTLLSSLRSLFSFFWTWISWPLSVHSVPFHTQHPMLWSFRQHCGTAFCVLPCTYSIPEVLSTERLRVASDFCGGHTHRQMTWSSDFKQIVKSRLFGILDCEPSKCVNDSTRAWIITHSH